MKLFNSLRFRLLILYFLTIIIPTVIIMFTMPFYYRNIISAETTKLTSSTMVALMNNIDTYLDDLERLTSIPYRKEFMDALAFQNSVKDIGNGDTFSYYDKFKAEAEILDTLIFTLQTTRKDISGAIMVTVDGTPIITNKKYGSRPDTTPNYIFTAQNWYKKAVAADGKAVFINVHPQDYLSDYTANQVFSIARLIKEPTTQKWMGVIMADAETSGLDEIFKGIYFNVESIVSIFDSNNNLIYSNGNISDDEKRQVFNGNAIVKGSKDSYAAIVKPIERAGWKMVVLLSDSELKSKLMWIYIVGILFAVGELILAFSLFSILSRLITNPFRKMIWVMKEVEGGNLQARFNVRKKDEISQLGNALNNMIMRLNDLIDREFRAVLSKRNAEYYALQSQIQPHFLYNTLNGFIGLNRLGAREELENAIFALTGMLRYTLEQGDWTTIAEEFLFLQRYCELQKTRFKDRLFVNIHFDECVAGFKIPKLLIQPLVENAIIHGIEPGCNKGILQVFGSLESDGYNDSSLTIIIDDNGTGFDTDVLSQGKNIGLSNVRERLNMTYNGAEFNIQSKIGLGTHIVIKIPEKEVRV